ncbi:MAG: hypothetical protein IT431_02930 [Phycisphaerales bacterium]|nr:hypothetical protein [Phycisphaerales bacterium]
MRSHPTSLATLIDHAKLMWESEVENATRLAGRKRQLVTLTTTLAGLLVAGLYKVDWGALFPAIFRGLPLLVMLKLCAAAVLALLVGLSFESFVRSLQCVLAPMAKLEGPGKPGGESDSIDEEELGTASQSLNLPEETVEAVLGLADMETADEAELEVFRARYVAALDLRGRNSAAKRVAFWMQKEITQGITRTIWAIIA